MQLSHLVINDLSKMNSRLSLPTYVTQHRSSLKTQLVIAFVAFIEFIALNAFNAKNAIQRNTTQYNAIQRNTTQYNAIQL